MTKISASFAPQQPAAIIGENESENRQWLSATTAKSGENGIGENEEGNTVVNR